MNIDTFPLPHPDEIMTYDEVVRLIDEFNKHFWRYLPDFSFGHITLSDFNLGDDSILFCLDAQSIADWREYRMRYDGLSRADCDEQEVVIKQFLNYLLAVPEAIRDYDDEEFEHD